MFTTPFDNVSFLVDNIRIDGGVNEDQGLEDAGSAVDLVEASQSKNRNKRSNRKSTDTVPAGRIEGAILVGSYLQGESVRFKTAS